MSKKIKKSYTTRIKMDLADVLGQLDLDSKLESKLADRIYDAFEGKPISGFELQDFLTEIAEDQEFAGFTALLVAELDESMTEVFQDHVIVNTAA